jgi:hypothetical protein
MKALLQASWLIISCLSAGYALPADNPQDAMQVLEDETRAVITSWASAWQSQLDDVYLLHYHPDFVPETGSRSEWETLRRRRLMDPEEISIGLREFELVKSSESEALVRFWLVYSRPDYADRTHKEITLRKNGQLWQITRERNLEVTRLP